MANLLLAVTLILWGLSLMGILAVSNVLLGILALITGVLILVGNFVALPAVPYTRRPNA
jgi:hypothetical protein